MNVDCWGIWGLDGQWTPTLGGLQGTDVGAPHRPLQVPWRQTSWSRGELATDAGEVRAGVDRSRGQKGLRDGATMQGVGGRYRGKDSSGADPVVAACPGGGLGVSTH